MSSDPRVDLELVAQDRINDPMSNWPDHINSHSRTLLGELLTDPLCLRCWLEIVATKQARERLENEVGQVEVDE